VASEFLSSEIWETLVQRTRTARRRQFAVSYVSEDSRLRLREGDVFVTDASDGAIRSGQTSAAVLHRAHERGVKIFSCENLHAKVYVCDGWMLVGSANTSANSRSLTEAGISSNDRALVEAAKAWDCRLGQQWNASHQPLSQANRGNSGRSPGKGTTPIEADASRSD
jgi:phosphatidylserine/phosphatidylglycerophosphate/cardiolipin synthase-like enzyme